MWLQCDTVIPSPAGLHPQDEHLVGAGFVGAGFVGAGFVGAGGGGFVGAGGEGGGGVGGFVGVIAGQLLLHLS